MCPLLIFDHVADQHIRFEVNIGVIAACAPIMKPFYRYIQARISGTDPHDLIHRSHPGKWSWHSQWYSRIWSRPSLPSAVPQQAPSKEMHPRAKFPYGVGTYLSDTERPTDKSVSLHLPLQGAYAGGHGNTTESGDTKTYRESLEVSGQLWKDRSYV